MNDKRSKHSSYPTLLGVSGLGFGALFQRLRWRVKGKGTECKGDWTPRNSESLGEGEGWLRSIVRYVSDVITVFEADGTLRYASPSLVQVLGYDPENLRGTTLRELLHPNDIEQVVGTFVEIWSNPGVNPPVEVRVQHADGSWRCLEVTANNLLADPGMRGVVIVSRDVTERKRIEEELRRSENSLASAQRIAHVGNWVHEVDTDETYWSDEMYRIFGLAPREFVPTYKAFLRFVHPDDRALVPKTVREVLHADKTPSLDYRVVRPDGEVRNVHTQYEVVYDETGRPMRLVGTVHDITERKVLEERLEYQAFHDALTGLPNRVLFMDRLGHALTRIERHKKSIAVLFLDLDNFKFVNDSLGHEIGDRLLIEVAKRLSACLRPEDTVARLGGDEFTILLEDAGGVSEAISVAERIAEALQASFDLGEHQLFTSASIGIVLGSSARERPVDLLRNADLAMYEAKNKGKARYEVFDPGMTRRSTKRLEMESDLRRALKRDEFKVLYQPKMLIKDGKITGVEALVRWEHPERGLINPSEFVPLAEEIGLILPIGYKVLKEACRQACAWQERYPGSPQTMYVNLSAKQFKDPRLVEEVTKVVRETGVDPSSLALEITENVLMSDPESSAAKLRTLRGLGVRVVVDDFGTAYSSLPRLGRFPMDFLNIDRSFTLRLGIEPEDTAIVSAMINLAHSLGWAVTAEGVETADQLARLQELGCDMAQGYYLWEPSSSAEVSAFLEAAS